MNKEKTAQVNEQLVTNIPMDETDKFIKIIKDIAKQVKEHEERISKLEYN